ncbi:MAG: ATP-dependent DNA helicase RecG [Candidatus Paceibacterota bacterium]|jgi:ATP-dependent DNA helicase RecG
MNPLSRIEEHFRLKAEQRAALARLGIETVEDLLYHFPSRYGDTAEARAISTLEKGQVAVVYGEITKLKVSKGFRSRIPMAEGIVTDASGMTVKAVWFNQPYLAKMTPEKSLVRVEGKVSERKGSLYLSNPKLERLAELPEGVGDSLFGAEGQVHTLYPVYPESRGVTSNWVYHSIQKIFKSGILDVLVDPLPADMLKKYNLPTLATAFVWIHAPQRAEDAMAARKRFAFEEVFFIQLEKQRERRAYQAGPAFLIDKTAEEMEEFISRFPFDATVTQRHAIETILSDFRRGHAMSRLLEGDVGSGKTAVAATTVYAATTTRPLGQNHGALQTAYMCPTEILATQHFESFIGYFRHMPVQIGLITGSGCRKFPSKVNPGGWTDISRAQLLKWVANGEIPILIGTHALIQKSVKFKNLAYVIVDEQHRFGTGQRQKLVRKDGVTPHLLSMTATPIPRTLALTVFGDLDLSLLDEMPHGRKAIITEIVMPDKREEMYEKVRAELAAGRQAYIICPRIDEPDPAKELAVQAKSVKEEAKRLKKDIFPEYELGVLHSKMKDGDKEDVMNDFKSGKTHILVATSVVEVGVNVPNATVIIIEGAERFGLSQLHQLRGRVIRSNHQAYCFVYAESSGEKTRERLMALKTAKNGFELAEYDLKFRGAGDLYGRKQWGISDVGMEAIQNLKMVEAARAEASCLLDEDAAFAKYPRIKAELSRRESQKIHFE